MNNEIGRKITSLTLMTIMLAGGLTFAVPGMEPAFAANANLFVSAENSQFDNYMSGPQVIEVVIIDSDINDTNEAKGEPDVTVNGKILRMVQAVDGNWYGYFADRDQAQIADSTAEKAGSGLDFGSFCSADDSGVAVGIDLSDTVGFTSGNVAGGNILGSASGGDLSSTVCKAQTTIEKSNNNVVREAKDLNTNDAANKSTTAGQIGLKDNGVSWPIIQLYPLSPGGNVNVQYNKGGGAQSVSLTFDTVDQFAGISLDRAVYPQGSQIHATITDLWLNIDPTDEDSWTFGTNSGNTTSSGAHYQVFDENGKSGGDAFNIDSTINSLMCDGNCRLHVDTNAQGSTNPVITIQDNDDSILHNLNKTQGGKTVASANNATAFGVLDATNRLGIGSVPVTITEQDPKSGVFGTYDESDLSVLKITTDAKRGTSATVDYNDSPVTVLVGFDFASIDIIPTDDEWSSGEEIPVVIVDADQNKNSRADENLDLDNPDVTLIPTLSTGDPFTIGEGTSKPKINIFNATRTVLSDSVPKNMDVGKLVNYTIIERSPSGEDIIPTVKVDTFSQRAILEQKANLTAQVGIVVVDLGTTMDELQNTINQVGTSDGNPKDGVAFNFFNYNVESFGASKVSIFLLNHTDPILAENGTYIGPQNNVRNAVVLVANGTGQGYVSLDGSDKYLFNATDPTIQNLGLAIEFDYDGSAKRGVKNIDAKEAIVADFFSFGFTGNGVQSSERFANQIIRIEAEESGDNTSTFEGSLEYVMVNQLNIQDVDTFAGIAPIDSSPSFIVIEDLTDEDSPRVNYNDLGADGVVTAVSDQEEAPSHSGVVSLNQDSYKIADTVIITLEDLDLNVDSALIDIFTVVPAHDGATEDTVGSSDTQSLSFGELGRLLDVTYDDIQWETPEVDSCTSDGEEATEKSSLEDATSDTGLGATGFTLIETGTETGVFTGDFQIPSFWCPDADKSVADTSVAGKIATYKTTTGLDIEVNYVDFRDASGEIVEVGDSAGVSANTGSVSLDRTVYPVPFGTVADSNLPAAVAPAGRSVFPIHATGIDKDIDNADNKQEELPSGDLTIHVRVNDPDFDVNPSGEDSINIPVAKTGFGPVKISVIRGSDQVILGYAGSPAVTGLIDVGGDNSTTTAIRNFGPINEIAPDAGIYEADIIVKYTDGPASKLCPNKSIYEVLDDRPRENNKYAVGNAEYRFDLAENSETEDFCILQGDILQVEYTDPADASGDVNTVTDSATFDLRNGVLQSDKSVYIIGSDMILTLIEPDFDLDNDSAETYDLDLIEWDSDAATTTMGDEATDSTLTAAFDPEPTAFRETGDSTGIFQIVIEIPNALGGDNLERGEEIVLEYTDWGPSGSDYVGDEDEDVNITVFTSNFGATVELDQKVYSWTDKVYITIVAPDHNFDGDLVDEIGDTGADSISISTRGFNIDNYKLVETGTDTGIFTGEVILTGFKAHDADGDGIDEDATARQSADGSGPTDGLLPNDGDDGIAVSFEFSEDETVIGSSLIRWNIGEIQWLEASYPASGTGVVRIIDSDMNLNPESVDNFKVDVWSDSDSGGIDLTVTETNEATGIFEGTVFFTVNDASSGHRLRVAEGDTITAEYEDNTLPNPYSTADELNVTATSLIGTIVPPLERAPITNLRAVDAFGNSLDAVSVDQQVQISADLANGQDREQPFAYLVQIQDGNGVTVSLAWITGSLSAGQSFSPALSWIPAQAGTYTATAFVWESVDNPTALSPPVSTTVTVQ